MPDQYNSQLFSQLLSQTSNSGGKPSFAFGWLPLGDVNVGSGFSLQAAAPLGKNIPSLLQPIGKPGSVADKMLQAIMNVPAELRQMASQAGVFYAGEVASLQGGVSSAASFVSSVGNAIQAAESFIER